MKTIAVIGAGPGLGFSLAKTFGGHGFRIAMVSRTQEKLDQYAVELSVTANLLCPAIDAGRCPQIDGNGDLDWYRKGKAVLGRSLFE
ncbi:SDR family NAD(P)-dependent oxidoreductase [Paenibacillus sp. SI8]|uniref:SDR family NAD(P)-dependent oxidoreductase n=1 Tax=unclassified Paenibacillus TaxID=185978 RepID=UPI003467DE81